MLIVVGGVVDGGSVVDVDSDSDGDIVRWVVLVLVELSSAS